MQLDLTSSQIQLRPFEPMDPPLEKELEVFGHEFRINQRTFYQLLS